MCVPPENMRALRGAHLHDAGARGARPHGSQPGRARHPPAGRQGRASCVAPPHKDAAVFLHTARQFCALDVLDLVVFAAADEFVDLLHHG